jgi:hypothetical protein
MNFRLWVESLEQIQSICQDVSKKMHCHLGGSCMTFAAIATKELLKSGLNDFKVIEGWVKHPQERFWRQHTWLDVHGVKIDPTFIQFNAIGNVKYVSKIKKAYTPEEYIELDKKYPSNDSDYLIK